MLMVAFRDLQWRRRRFVIAIIATGVVFAITLLLSGMDSGFKNETVRTVDAFHTDAWVVPRGAAGPFTSPTAFPGDETFAAGDRRMSACGWLRGLATTRCVSCPRRLPSSRRSCGGSLSEAAPPAPG